MQADDDIDFAKIFGYDDIEQPPSQQTYKVVATDIRTGQKVRNYGSGVKNEVNQFPEQARSNSYKK